jgi:hypothetical protein
MAKAKKSRVVGIPGAMADKKWRAESDLRTLLDACEIRKDKARFKAAQAMAKDKVAEMAKIAAGERGEY